MSDYQVITVGSFPSPLEEPGDHILYMSRINDSQVVKLTAQRGGCGGLGNSTVGNEVSQSGSNCH